MNPRILAASAKRSLRSWAIPTTTTTMASGIHTAFPASFAYASSSVHAASSSGTHNSTHPNSAAFQGHSSDVYKKDIDSSPPENTKLHSIDPEAEVENPTASLAPAPNAAAPSGAAETSTSEQQRVNAYSHPYYAAPGPCQNYGNSKEGS